MKTKWLDRALTISAYHFCLCLTEKEFYAELKRIEVPIGDWPRFVKNSHSDATLHYLEHKNGNRIAIVCLDQEKAATKTGIQIASLLVHEAVHIWQRHTAAIGSFNDHGDEEEAYAIQNIAQSLIEEYARRMIQKKVTYRRGV